VLKKKIWANFQRIIELLPKKLSLSFQKYVLGSGIRDPGSRKTYSGSRIQGSKRHRIRIRNTGFCRYEEPVSDVSSLQRMRNTPEYDRKASVPVKAAPKDASCSRFQASSHLRLHSPRKPVLRLDLGVVLRIRNDFFFFGSVSGSGSYFSVGFGRIFSNIIYINLIFEFPSCVLDCMLWRDISFLEFFI
jgi:hypothetical protein